MLNLLFAVLSAIPGLAGKFLDWQVKRANAELEGFRHGATIDLDAFRAYLNAQAETNRMKLAQNSWWGAKLIILIAGVTASVHFGLVMVDSMCPASWGLGRIPAKGGCGMGIPALPPPYDTYQWAIVQSFFLVMPAMPLANAVSQWLARK